VEYNTHRSTEQGRGAQIVAEEIQGTQEKEGIRQQQQPSPRERKSMRSMITKRT